MFSGRRIQLYHLEKQQMAAVLDFQDGRHIKTYIATSRWHSIKILVSIGICFQGQGIQLCHLEKQMFSGSMNTTVSFKKQQMVAILDFQDSHHIKNISIHILASMWHTIKILVSMHIFSRLRSTTIPFKKQQMATILHFQDGHHIKTNFINI